MTKLYTVDAFTKSGHGGNAAGVVLDAETLSSDEMQAIAHLAGFSETAFITEEGASTHHVRFFAPEDEVGLCGHATVASYHLLHELGRIDSGRFTMNTKSGPQEVVVDDDGRVEMTQNLPTFGPEVSVADVAPALGLAAEQLGGLVPQVASTGLFKVFVPVPSLEVLAAVKPDFAAIETVSRGVSAIGMYVYCLDVAEGITARCRNFAPVVGILEDSATGTSAAALASLLHHRGQVDGGEGTWLRFEQGYAIDQPSEILVELAATDGSVCGVRVAGLATTRGVRELGEDELEGKTS